MSMSVPKRAHAQKSTCHKKHIPKWAHAKMSMCKNEHMSKRAHAKMRTCQNEHIPKKRHAKGAQPNKNTCQKEYILKRSHAKMRTYQKERTDKSSFTLHFLVFSKWVAEGVASDPYDTNPHVKEEPSFKILLYYWSPKYWVVIELKPRKL